MVCYFRVSVFLVFISLIGYSCQSINNTSSSIIKNTAPVTETDHWADEFDLRYYFDKDSTILLSKTKESLDKLIPFFTSDTFASTYYIVLEGFSTKDEYEKNPMIDILRCISVVDYFEKNWGLPRRLFNMVDTKYSRTYNEHQSGVYIRVHQYKFLNGR
ncbi:MAG: hypothetical protein ACXWEY_13925 [Bacteroidia bacterium]